MRLKNVAQLFKVCSGHWPIYLAYMLGAWLLVMGLANIQFFLIYGKFSPKFLIVPSIVGLIVGFLIAKYRILRDRIEAKQMEFSSIVEMAEEVSYFQNLDRSYRFISPSVLKLTGYDVSIFYQMPNLFSDLVYEDDFPKWLAYERGIAEGDRLDAIDVRLTTKHKGLIWIRHVSRPIYEKGKLVAISSTNTDITEQVSQTEAMKELALKDSLTGLPNRRHLSLEAEKMLDAIYPFVLIMMDLDRFKTINDSLGHSVGDLMLQKIKDRFELVLPQGALLSRFGGDEFVFIIPGIRQEQDVEQMIRDFLKVVERPMHLNGLNLHISASFGWVSAPEDGSDVESLIRFADVAMHMAKQKQGVYSLRYSGQVDHYHQRLLIIENRIRNAVEDKRIVPFYQPMFSTQSGNLVGVECLARWHDDELGWVSPDEFIPIAEDINLIGKLGETILEQAIITAKKLSEFCSEKDVYFSVNASPYQLSEIGFVDKVKSLLEQYDLPPKLLKIEVTESLFIGGNEYAINVLSELRAFGVSIALDDFGTGYSAFAVLREGCIDILKVDKSFIQNMTDNDQEKALVAEIIQMAHIMDLTVVAEGVETEAQRALLAEIGCDVLQGYLLARPMSEIEFCPYMDCGAVAH
ncbi:GGDEF and EAL domain-containing protein [Hydrogenovibrio sp. 3SP14C1]|uniref:putative bifunctional diguanylate cyclase/phosphodiesterase n=1 Tax=Hydrogenovibrio sp. 3SP14C1 TaxID=3038774 RepID=UPI002415C95F|nr:GGDEF and EAL domain-containing protein [Hydrogenovibrio sp. 3SP14C1]MDG4813283.1 GGDEF and EAL domain-containing protein [Hydrogenovibrio sp. 3SP14C1]